MFAALQGLSLAWRIVALASFALALYGAGFGSAWRLKTLMEEAARAEMAEAARAVEHRQAEAAAAIATAAEARQVEIREVTKTIIKKVPVHVSAKSDAACAVPRGFVRLHDQSAGGRVPEGPDPAGQPDDAASGVALSAVAGTVADNYGTCRETAERLKALQEWARAVGAAESAAAQ